MADSTHPPVPAATPSSISFKRVFWPVLLSLVMLGVVAGFTFDPESFAEIVMRMNPWGLAAAVATLVVRVVAGGWRLSYISGGRIGLMAGVRGQLAWDFFSNISPSAVGGGPFAGVYVARDARMRIGEATALMLFAMLLDQLWFALTIPVVVVASFFVDVIPRSLGTIGAAAFLLYFGAMLVWVVGFGYATLYRPDLLERFARWVFRVKWLRRFRVHVEHEMRQLQRRARILRTQPARFYVNGMLLTALTWMSRYMLLFFVVWAVLDAFDGVLLLLRTAALMLGTIVLPTPGGSGGVEGLYALLIGPMLPKAAVAPTLLVWRVLGYYLFIGVGVFLSTHHVGQAIRRRHRAAAPDAAPEAEPGAPEPGPAENQPTLPP